MEREVYPEAETIVIRAAGIELCLTRGGRRTWASDRFTLHADLTDAEFVTVTEEALSGKRGAFPGIVRRAFGKLPSRDQEQLLAALRERLPELADQLAPELVAFESLAGTDNRILQKLAVEFPPEEWARALQGAPDGVRRAVLQNLSERARQMLTRELGYQTRTDSAETNRLREKIVTRLRQHRGV